MTPDTARAILATLPKIGPSAEPSRSERAAFERRVAALRHRRFVYVRHTQPV